MSRAENTVQRTKMQYALLLVLIEENEGGLAVCMGRDRPNIRACMLNKNGNARLFTNAGMDTLWWGIRLLKFTKAGMKTL